MLSIRDESKRHRRQKSFKLSKTVGKLLGPYDATSRHFGDAVVVVFVLVQALDGGLTYLGVHIWGLAIEANPLVSSAVSFAGVGAGLAAAKLLAVGLGMTLHLRRVHGVVALLTAFYVTVAILPWTLLFLTL